MAYPGYPGVIGQNAREKSVFAHFPCPLREIMQEAGVRTILKLPDVPSSILPLIWTSELLTGSCAKDDRIASKRALFGILLPGLQCQGRGGTFFDQNKLFKFFRRFLMFIYVSNQDQKFFLGDLKIWVRVRPYYSFDQKAIQNYHISGKWYFRMVFGRIDLILFLLDFYCSHDRFCKVTLRSTSILIFDLTMGKLKK